MEVSRILRVLITLILVITFIISTLAAYRQNREINAMTTLSDSTSSIVTSLATQDLAWTDAAGDSHPYIINKNKLQNLDYTKTLAGENLTYQTKVVYQQDNTKEIIGPYGPSPPEDRMISTVSAPITLVEGRKPAKLEVVAWYS